jgi:hypothetical protein
MLINRSLHKFLEAMAKEKDKSVWFLVPAGKIRGTFESYDTPNNAVTITNPSLSDVAMGATLTILGDAIQAWGK